MMLRAALVTPLSGPLASYGLAAATGLRLWAERAAQLPPPWRGVILDVEDTGTGASSAMRAAVQRHPQVVFGPYGSSQAVAALAATERVVWNHGGATSRLRKPRFDRAINVLSPASSYFLGALEAIRAADGEARTVALAHGNTGFGRDVAAGAAEAAHRLGFQVSPVAFDPAAAARAADLVPDADALLVVDRFEDELAAARALLGRGWKAAVFVGAGVEEVLAELGEAREGLLGPAQWLAEAAPTPDEGPDSAWFVAAYRQATGSAPAYPAVQAFAAGVLAARCLREAGSVDDAAQLAAAGWLSCATLFGRFRLDPVSGLQIGHQVLTVQWQDGERYVVWPPEAAQRPLRYPLPAP